MQLKVTGKSIDVGDALRSHVSTRIEAALGKLFTGGSAGHVTFERERGQFRSECSIHLDSGMHLQAHGVSGDPYQSFDQAAERLEKRLRRYKRRLKDRHGAREQVRLEQASYVTFAATPDEEPDEDARDGLYPAVVAEATTPLHTLSVAEAVMQLDLADAPVILFRNAAHGGLNVIYRRTDGNIGWIDPNGQGEAGTRQG